MKVSFRNNKGESGGGEWGRGESYPFNLKKKKKRGIGEKKTLSFIIHQFIDCCSLKCVPVVFDARYEVPLLGQGDEGWT